MAAIATLAELMAEAADPAAHILTFLPPASLAALQCTCCQMRTTVAAQPESMWKVSPCAAAVAPSCTAAETTTRLQAAAERESPAHHPVLQAPNVRLYLQQRHAISRNLATKTYTCSPLNLQADGDLSPDFSLLARLDDDSTLHIWDVDASPLAHQWGLPQTAFPYCDHAVWCQNSPLMLSYGDRSSAERRLAAGLVFVTTCTGESCVIALQSQPKKIQLFSSPHSSRVLVVQSRQLSVYSGKGRLVARVQHPEPSDSVTCCLWASSGTALAFQIHGQALWLWDLASDTVVQLAAAAAWAAWATPASDCLLVGGAGLPCTQHTMQTQHSTSFQLPDGTISAAWGTRLVLLVKTDPSFELQIRGCDGQLALERTFALGPWVFDGDLVLARNGGKHCAGVIGLDMPPYQHVASDGFVYAHSTWYTSSPRLQRGRLVILDLAACRLVMLSLPEQLAWSAADLSVQWSPACDSVLATRGLTCYLFSFTD